MKKLFLIMAILLPTTVFAADAKIEAQIVKLMVAAKNDKAANEIYKHEAKNYLTSDLSKAIAAEEKASAIKDCGKDYAKSEEVCGIEYAPLVCGQDSNDKPTILSVKDLGGDRYEADVKWVKITKYISKFRFAKQNGRLLIDGISCPEELGNFNWK